MLLEVQELVVRYGAATALQGISLRVDEGEAVAVLGPNGAGKTTLLRTISGLVDAASGSVSFGGRSLRRFRPHRVALAGFAHVPEGRGSLSPLTVRENLVLGARVSAARKAVPAIEEMIELFPALGRRLDTRAGLLSGGEQQMLAIARGLIARPKLLAIDEPSMGLAPVAVEAVSEALGAIRARGTALLVAEQNAQVALEVTDRVYVLVHGEVVETAASGDVGEDLIETYIA